jgi:aryl-alcohol dehydrogenase-like predicted oxidoreductase
MFMKLTRRELMKAGLGLGVSTLLPRERLFAQAGNQILRKIPSSGEALPVIGIGTARRYTPDAKEEITEVVRLLPKLGGRVIDTAPSYGQAEVVVGDVVAAVGNRDALFLATKVGAEGREAGMKQLEASFQRMKTDTIDLIAVHNLRDTATQLGNLRDLRDKGRIRYIGVTSTSERQYEELEKVIRTERLDFVQVDYALDVRRAGDRVLPAAQERGVAVMTALPFGRGRLFEAVQGQQLPDWAKEFDCQTWAQFFLKYLVSHPAVTVAIPGTARVKYLEDNQGAGRGRLPDAAMRKRMEEFIDTL